MGRTITRRATAVTAAAETPALSPTAMASKGIAALLLQAEAKSANDRVTALKAELLEGIEKYADAEVDEKGSRFFYFQNPVNAGDKQFKGLKRERRASPTFDEDAARTVLAEKGLLDRVEKEVTETVFDQDEIYVLNQEGLITDDELDSFITQTITYAFVPVKA